MASNPHPDRSGTVALLFRLPCDHFIEVEGDRWAGTYCKLLAGHDGPHSALYPDERATSDEQSAKTEGS